jgi:hypothetical protein
MSGEHTGTGPDFNRMTSSSSRQRDLPRHLRSTERGAEGEEPEGAFSAQRSAFGVLALCPLLPAARSAFRIQPSALRSLLTAFRFRELKFQV